MLLQLASAEKQILGDNWNHSKFEQPLRRQWFKTVFSSHSLIPVTSTAQLNNGSYSAGWPEERKVSVNIHSLGPCGGKELDLMMSLKNQPNSCIQ